MPLALRGFRGVSRSVAASGADTPKHQLARGHIHLCAFEACREPDFCHDIVGRTVAPPCTMMLRFRRQFHSGDPLDLTECKRDLQRALATQERSKWLILAHRISPPQVVV